MLLTAAQYRQSMDPDGDPRNDVEYTRLIAVAQRRVEQETGRVLEQATVTRTYDGSAALGPVGRPRTLLRGPASDRYVLHSGGNLVTVTENGVALTVGTGYDTSSNVVLSNVNTDAPLRLFKRAGWLKGDGIENITVSYTCGWTTGTVPDTVTQLLREIVFRLFHVATWHEVLARSSTVWSKELSPMAQATLNGLRVYS